MGERDRAIECFDRAIAMEPNGFIALRFGSIRAFLAGDREEALRRARALDDELQQEGERDAEHFYLMAGNFGLIGERARCVHWLGRAVEAGFFNYPAMLREPFFDSVRDDAGFQQVLARAREKHEAFKAAFSAMMP
jgi:tetratricopeptide (TPR) repeat protein